MYRGFQERKNSERILAEQKERERIILETEQNNLANKPSKITYRGKAEIAVTSLFHGAGSTYLSMILATFLGGCKNSKTCLIETKGLDEEILRPAMDIVTYPCDLTDVYRQGYEFIVRDYGIYDKISREAFPDFERADFKCVVAWPDETSLSRLSSFVRTVEKADSYIYFFNMVPKDRTRELLDIMEDYKTIILPCTSVEKLDKTLVTELYKLFGKG